jgi:hypothetical protein
VTVQIYDEVEEANEFDVKKENEGQGEIEKRGFLLDCFKSRDKKNEEFQLEDSLQTDFWHLLIIHPDSMWKSIFDVFILILVTYSCIYTILNNTFDIEQRYPLIVTYWVVESFFYLDFLLSWFQGFRDVEEQKIIFEFKKIAKRYLRTWFFIDFISIFPFPLFLGTGGQVTKLFRLPRMLRLVKILDINNVKSLLIRFQGEISNAN